VVLATPGLVVTEFKLNSIVAGLVLLTALIVKNLNPKPFDQIQINYLSKKLKLDFLFPKLNL